MLINVLKASGLKEPLSVEKIHRVLEWAAEGLKVSVSAVELKARLQIVEGTKTSDIHETLVKTAADMISEKSPDYQWFSARLKMFRMRKEAYGTFAPPVLLNHVQRLTIQGLYDGHLLRDYSLTDWHHMNEMIDHSKDMNFAYAATVQLREKYLVQNRVTGELFESPQMAYILIAAALFANEHPDVRLGYVEKFYKAVSGGKLSLPTPIMAGVRTPTRQFSSCVLIEAGDSLDSINGANNAITKYVSQRAGIGINAGALRGAGAEIRGGEAYHTGLIPFFKTFQASVKSCSQGGLRGGSATLFYPLWTWEAESLLVLKNNRGTENNRVRHLDYGVQLNKLMYNRLVKGQNITLFSMDEVPDLLDAFYADQDEFERLYTKYEQDDSIRRRSIPASELFGVLASERASTGRIYIQNIDHNNTHGAFDPTVAPIKQSNLCLEIALPTKPLDAMNPSEGEIALCTLLAFNLGAIESLDEYEELSDIAVRALDNLLDYQGYPHPAALIAKKRKALGVGVTNLAYYLAKNNVKYSDGSALTLVHETMEAVQYSLLSASNKLAKERGACELFEETRYANGELPIDHYRPSVDNICNAPLKRDWEALRARIAKDGLRNSTLTALMPCETSSQITNSTNGIEPPRGFISVKSSKNGAFKQVVPEFERLKDQYELLWTLPNNKGYLDLVAVMTKFIDQAVSANTNYDPEKFAGGKVTMKTVLDEMIYAWKIGVKNLYYHNTRDGSGEEIEDDCESCKV